MLATASPRILATQDCANRPYLQFSAFLGESESSDSEVEMEEKIERPKRNGVSAPKQKQTPVVTNGSHDEEGDQVEENGEEDEEEEEEDIPLSDLEELDEDIIPHQRLTINNTTALLASLSRIALPTDASVPFAQHQTIISTTPTADAIPDVMDDLAREKEFYEQALDAARRGRAALLRENVPFTRPVDFFAEMVKDDPHMDKVKQKLVAEATAKKAAAEARKQRDLRKFGKKVQVAKLQERHKEKREALEKIKTLKRSKSFFFHYAMTRRRLHHLPERQESGTGDLGANEAADLFDVAVDNEISAHANRQRSGRGGPLSAGARRGGRGAGDRDRDAPNAKRQKKNEKYGFGGKKRYGKSGDAISSGDLSGANFRGMKGAGFGGGRGGRGGRRTPAARPGKARRAAARR
jgi:rRNA-processing protein EBP2